MKASAKHTINVATEYHAPMFGTDRLPKDYCARHLNVQRIAKDMDLTEEQAQHLDSLVLIKEGVGDYWVAYKKAAYLSPIGKGAARHNKNNWLVVEEKLSECAQGVIDSL